MAGMGKQTAVLTAARFANYGLVLISPIILVRILSVEQFGQYRQFVVYASFLTLFASFSFTESLLYFVPSYGKSVWRIAKQTNLLTACSSMMVVVALILLDLSLKHAVVGPYLWPLVAYVLLFVNLDFWEYFFLAIRRPGAVFAYTTGRLTARMATVIVVALVTANVTTIIWALVGLEAVRISIACMFWRLMDRSADEPPIANVWREQLRYCVPTGFAMMLNIANRNLGNVAVAKVLGPVSLAHYTIGTYAEYFYFALGYSIALVLLAEMVRRNTESPGSALLLWQKTTVVNCILLLPVAILLARFAEPIIITLFGKGYRPAVLVMQVHMFFMIRACFDFSPAVRALNRTRAFVYCNMAALIVNAIALSVLLPAYGIVGAVGALVISSYADAFVLGWAAIRLYGVPLRSFIPWKSVGKVALSAAISAAVIWSSVWVEWFGMAGVIVASIAYYAAFVSMLRILGVSELNTLALKVRNSLSMAFSYGRW
jgi:O-antigen/teichoic acid export membrane protein